MSLSPRSAMRTLAPKKKQNKKPTKSHSTAQRQPLNAKPSETAQQKAQHDSGYLDFLSLPVFSVSCLLARSTPPPLAWSGRGSSTLRAILTRAEPSVSGLSNPQIASESEEETKHTNVSSIPLTLSCFVRNNITKCVSLCLTLVVLTYQPFL